MSENWKDVLGWEGLYQVSDLGNVRSIRRSGKTQYGWRSYGGELVKPFRHRTSGYLVVNLTGKGRRSQILVHRLVLEAFIGSRPRGMEGCHNNGNRLDPRLENLRWDTRKNNHADKRAHGTAQIGERSGTAKLNDAVVRAIRDGKDSIVAWMARLGVSRNTIARVRNRQTWRHLP